MPQRNGIILAGGSGARLPPAILAIRKQLLLVYDKARSVEEKALKLKSSYACTGPYFYDKQVVDIAKAGLKVACPAEIVWRNGFITSEQLEKLGWPLAKNGFGQYLLSLLSSRARSGSHVSKSNHERYLYRYS